MLSITKRMSPLVLWKQTLSNVNVDKKNTTHIVNKKYFPKILQAFFLRLQSRDLVCKPFTVKNNDQKILFFPYKNSK